MVGETLQSIRQGTGTGAAAAAAAVCLCLANAGTTNTPRSPVATILLAGDVPRNIVPRAGADTMIGDFSEI